MRNVTLSRQFAKTVAAYRMVVIVTHGNNVDKNLFLYLGMPLISGETDNRAIFQGVCSPWDMTDVPVGEPDVDASPAWLRYDRVDLVFRSVTEATEAWALITDQISILLRTLEQLDDLYGYIEEIGISEEV